MDTNTSHKSMFLRIFFVVFVLFVVIMIGVVLMKEPSAPTQIQMSSNLNTNVAPKNTNVNAASTQQQFLSRHAWYSSALKSQYTEKSAQDIITYDFGGDNAILDMPVSMTGTIEEAYGRVSATVVSVGAFSVDVVLGVSAKDGKPVTYAIVPYSDTRSLVARGEPDFVDDVLDGLVFAE